MRPSRLDPLFAPAVSLKGVGPRLEVLLTTLLGTATPPRVIDVLLHLPSGSIDRRFRPALAQAEPGRIVTVDVLIERHRPPGRAGLPYKVLASNETGDVTLVWFHGTRSHLERVMPVGEKRVVSGRLELYDGLRQIVHPDRVLTGEEAARLPAIETVYPLVNGLGPGTLRRTVDAALARLPVLPEWQDETFVAKRGFPPFAAAIEATHHPATPDDASPTSRAWTRLAYDEILAGQIALGLVRTRLKQSAGASRLGDGTLRRSLLSRLPFQLTPAQTEAVREIEADLALPTRMLRLLQGDVGAGKTVVALMAMAGVAETGRQSALMAPTELLARQHATSLAAMAETIGLGVALLTGREKGRERERLLERIATGDAQIAVGTHALIQDSVSFHRLGLAVIDEQHRFGVEQRLSLANKGSAVDTLLMTATPIPRTLVLTYFGDMEATQLRGKPPGRTPVDTRLVSMERLPEVVDAVGRALAEGRQVYWVCPLVEEGDDVEGSSGLTAATARHETLARRFGSQVGLVHGRMKGPERDMAMSDFAEGATRVLVATTVIEVGVDVPKASIMVVENAERFGLAQLHQLRGRVGRGTAASTCLLLYSSPLGETASRRLNMLRQTEDGFLIAEEDLRLRGEGDILGTRQSGMPGFRVARLDHHAELIDLARSDAKLLLSRDPSLTSPRGLAMRDCLHLFGRIEALRLLDAG